MKVKFTWQAALICSVAWVGGGVIPTPAYAQSSRERDLEARLKTLEAAVADLRAELVAARDANGEEGAALEAELPAIARQDETISAPPASAVAVAADAKPSVELSGFVKTYASISQLSDGVLPATSSGHDFYNPGTIPIGGKGEGASVRANVKQSRIALKVRTPLDRHRLEGLVEVDFQSSPGAGTQRITNAYNPALRRGFVIFNRLLIGQEWTNFQYLAALPETTDYLGPSEGTVFARQAQIRYTFPLSQALTVSLAAENPAAITAVEGTAAIVENDADRLPDVTGRLNLAVGGAELSLAGLARELSIQAEAGEDSAFGWGVSLAGKVALDRRRRHDVRFMFTHGDGIGRYVGLNLAPDAILASDLRMETVTVTAGFAALRYSWTDNLRSTLMASAQRIDYPEGLGLAGMNKEAWSASANLFYSPAKQIDFGVELRHGEREIVSGLGGRLDRLEFVAKYSF